MNIYERLLHGEANDGTVVMPRNVVPLVRVPPTRAMGRGASVIL